MPIAIMIPIIAIILVIVAIVSCTTIATKKGKKIVNSFIEDYVEDPDTVLYHYLQDLCDDVVEKNNITLVTFEIFKESCIGRVYNTAMERIDREGVNWIGIPDLTLEQSYDLVSKILKSKNFTIEIGHTYVDLVKKNIDEAQKNEDEAIRYNNQFSKDPDGDPELHPKEPNSEDTRQDEDHIMTIEALSSTGTVEDIEDQ